MEQSFHLDFQVRNLDKIHQTLLPQQKQTNDVTAVWRYTENYYF